MRNFAKTPPKGWNSWDAYAAAASDGQDKINSADQAEINAAAAAMNAAVSAIILFLITLYFISLSFAGQTLSPCKPFLYPVLQ